MKKLLLVILLVPMIAFGQDFGVAMSTPREPMTVDTAIVYTPTGILDFNKSVGNCLIAGGAFAINGITMNLINAYAIPKRRNAINEEIANLSNDILKMNNRILEINMKLLSNPNNAETLKKEKDLLNIKLSDSMKDLANPERAETLSKLAKREKAVSIIGYVSYGVSAACIITSGALYIKQQNLRKNVVISASPNMVTVSYNF